MQSHFLLEDCCECKGILFFLSSHILDRAIVSNPSQEHFLGRRGYKAAACILSIAATVGQCFSKNAAQLIGCRLVTGLTLAARASATPLLTAEVSPDPLRGKEHPFYGGWETKLPHDAKILAGNLARRPTA